MTSEENDRLTLVTLQLISQSIVRLPLAIAQNLTTARGTPAASPSSTGSTSSLADAMRKAAEGTAYNPLPLPPPPPLPPSRVEKIAGAANSAANFAANNQATRAAGGGIQAALGGVAARFAGLLGPMQILNQVVSSQASGFQVLGTATRVLAATIAPIILPVATVFAATLVKLSDVLWAKLLPNLDKFNRFVFGQLIPAGEGLIGLFSKLGDAIEWINKKIPGGGPGGGPGGESRGGVLENLDKGIDAARSLDVVGTAKRYANAVVAPFDPLDVSGRISRGAKSLLGGDKKEEAAGPAGSAAMLARASGGVFGSGAGGGGGMGDAMRDTLKELRLSMGTKASYSGLGDVQRNAQLAALNQSPFEAKILERMDKILTALERSAEGEPEPSFGAGGR